MDPILSLHVPGTLDISLCDCATGILEKQVIHEGEFDVSGQKFSVNEKVIDHWVNTFDEMTKEGIKVPVPVEHTRDPDKKRGHVLKLSKGRDSKGRLSLFSQLQFDKPEYAEKYQKTDVSLFCPPYRESSTGKKFYRPIEHIALTDYPAITGLDGFRVIAASLTTPEDDTMKLSELAEAMNVTVDPSAGDGAVAKAIMDEVASLRKENAELKEKVGDDPEENPEEKPEVKPEEKPEPAPIAASILEMAKDHRETKIQRLVEQGKITPAVAKDLQKQFCGDAAIKLSLTAEKVNDGFDAVIKAFGANESILSFSEKTGGQRLNLAEGEENPLVKDAENRRKAMFGG